jgi:two-component system OmpR family sensor kinase/two-component system sensor histidine kinase QseC
MAALRNGLRIVLSNRHDAQGRPAGLLARVHLRAADAGRAA